MSNATLSKVYRTHLLIALLSDGAIDQQTADSILERTLKLLPELSHGKGKDGLEIVRHSVGLRPTREGGPRVENEISSKFFLLTSLITIIKRLKILQQFRHTGKQTLIDNSLLWTWWLWLVVSVSSELNNDCNVNIIFH